MRSASANNASGATAHATCGKSITRSSAGLEMPSPESVVAKPCDCSRSTVSLMPGSRSVTMSPWRDLGVSVAPSRGCLDRRETGCAPRASERTSRERGRNHSTPVYTLFARAGPTRQPSRSHICAYALGNFFSTSAQSSDVSVTAALALVFRSVTNRYAATKKKPSFSVNMVWILAPCRAIATAIHRNRYTDACCATRIEAADRFPTTRR
jgi:hypothetical protein